MWHSMSEKEKQPYIDAYLAEKEKYDIIYEEYL